MIEKVIDVYGKEFAERQVKIVAVCVRPYLQRYVIIEAREGVNVIADHMVDVYRRVVSRHEEVISKAVILFVEKEIENALDNAVNARFQKVGYTYTERKTVAVLQRVNLFAVIVTRFRRGH